MTEELLLVSEQLDKATCVEDVFGFNEGNLRTYWRALLKAVHSDTHGGSELAQGLTARVNELKVLADGRVADGTYGLGRPLPEHEPISIGGYSVLPKPIHGDLADVYVGAARPMVKVARSPDDNDLLRAERVALKVLGKKIAGPAHDGIPRLLSTLQVDGVGGWRRDVNVLERFPGFLTVREVHEKSPSLDTRTLVWMFKRMLQTPVGITADGPTADHRAFTEAWKR